MLVCLIYLVCLVHVSSEVNKERPWEHPVIPANFDELINNEENSKLNKLSLSKPTDTLIPRNVWIAFREVPPINFMPDHIKHLVARATEDKWTINLIDGDDAEDLFMKTYYAHTSIFWAYKLLSPAAVVSKVDIWRYCVLYAFGGFYMDDDANIKESLNKVQ